jgi:hypothetical protein
MIQGSYEKIVPALYIMEYLETNTLTISNRFITIHPSEKKEIRHLKYITLQEVIAQAGGLAN